jgi:phage terminase large subunit-like protein
MQSNPFDKEKYPNVFDAYQYALDVIDGIIPNCVYIYGACKRFIKDLEENKYPFDADKAERYLKLTQKFNHVKGNWGSENIIYEPWQKFIFANIMGFINPVTKNRRFRTAHLEIARGQGKSAMASQMALYFLALDNPKGNEISCLATKTEQARIVLDSARAMAKHNPQYLKATGVEVLAHKIVHDKSNSFVRALSSDDKSLDGLNDILAICDELHAMNRELFEVISSGMSKRNDSLLLCITTAGFNTDGVGYDQSLYAKKVAKGEVKDESFFSAVYTIDEGDDIFDENVWKKANPNYGVSVDPITFQAKADKAKVTPSDIANFKVKHLNCWISEAQAYYDLFAWDKCKDTLLKFEDFYGEKAYVGIDLASKIDLTSFAILFRKEGIYYFFDRTYIPEETVKTTRSVVYDNAIARGELIATQGEAIHYPKLEQDFVALSKEINIISGLFDPWNAISFGQNMVKERIDMKEFRMTTANLSEATKTLDALIRQGRIKHNGSELIRWCLSNVVAKEDAAGNVFPKKSSDKLKIDPIVALIMALAAWMQEDQEDSVYETRGPIFL